MPVRSFMSFTASIERISTQGHRPYREDCLDLDYYRLMTLGFYSWFWVLPQRFSRYFGGGTQLRGRGRGRRATDRGHLGIRASSRGDGVSVKRTPFGRWKTPARVSKGTGNDLHRQLGI